MVTPVLYFTVVSIRDDLYPVCWFDIWQDSEFATGYGYPKCALKREPDTDPDIRNAFSDISRIQTFGKSCTLHNHSFTIFIQKHLFSHMFNLLIGHAKFVGMNLFLVCQDRALSVYN